MWCYWMQQMTAIIPCRVYWLLGCLCLSICNRYREFLEGINKYSVPFNGVPSILGCPVRIRHKHILPLCYLVLFLIALWKRPPASRVKFWRRTDGWRFGLSSGHVPSEYICYVLLVKTSASSELLSKQALQSTNQTPKYDSRCDYCMIPSFLSKKPWELLMSLLKLGSLVLACIIAIQEAKVNTTFGSLPESRVLSTISIWYESLAATYWAYSCRGRNNGKAVSLKEVKQLLVFMLVMDVHSKMVRQNRECLSKVLT